MKFSPVSIINGPSQVLNLVNCTGKIMSVISSLPARASFRFPGSGVLSPNVFFFSNDTTHNWSVFRVQRDSNIRRRVFGDPRAMVEYCPFSYWDGFHFYQAGNEIYSFQVPVTQFDGMSHFSSTHFLGRARRNNRFRLYFLCYTIYSSKT